ncbi:glycosyltransferase family 4 protein [Actinomadura rupiterrae]|uniref:glycosyltransferase family 4 protein n=1 Tax=Actinomadura rupiterrae TaxID=559627 RepID=UPI0020A32102|nr:glycosyltransferase [Actinomadura rupiterrae]MCP2337039.1 glycosyltransferase involved in cell wall biosynthesis [Actinomadura rupiterrae]
MTDRRPDTLQPPYATGHRAAYFAFDLFPSTKGAAVHIAQMADELFARFGGGLLGVTGGGRLPRRQVEDGREIVRFDDAVPNLLGRFEAFSSWVAGHVAEHAGTLELCHVRDPWGALPVVDAPGRRYQVVYEVNGLPSIELRHTRPGLPERTLAKIRELERHCLHAADAIIVPSRVNAEAVRGYGVPDGKVTVVPNGADVPDPRPRPDDAPDRYIIYVGALQPWQGLDVLMRAFARLADLPDLRLVVCSSVQARRAKPLRRLARHLGVEDRVEWRFTVPHAQVAAWLQHAELSVAPLTACARNLDQGCAPLKVLESMAAGTPVVASDLPVVRELMADREHGRLVPADRPAELARAVRVLLEYPDTARDMGARAREHVASTLTWDASRARLAEVYRTLAAHPAVPTRPMVPTVSAGTADSARPTLSARPVDRW